MTTTTSTPLRPRAARLDAAVAAIEDQRRAQVALMTEAAGFVLSAPEPVDADGGALFGERLLQVAGQGAPEVAEFAIIELAARLSWSVDAATTLVAQAVELIHRLPHVWSLTVAGVIPPRLAQQIADRTITVTASVAARADRWLVADPRGLGTKQVEATLDTLQLHEDPDRIVGLEESLLADRHVTLMPDKRTPSAVRVKMLLEPDDARAFDHAVADIAATLKALGDEDALQVRRAKAVGVLASPRPRSTSSTTASRPRGGRRSPISTSTSDSPTSRRPPTAHRVRSRSKGSGSSHPSWSAAGSKLLASRSTSGRCFTCQAVLSSVLAAVRSTRPPSAGLPSTATTHPRRCARSSSSVMRSALSPTAAAPAGTPTSTTSSPGSTLPKAVHPVRPTRTISLRCADGITGSRPTPTGPTDEQPTDRSRGPAPPVSRSPPPRADDDPPAPDPAATELRGYRHAQIGERLRRQGWR